MISLSSAGPGQAEPIETPKVSVVLNTYEHRPYIEKSLDSVLSQETTFPFEVLVSDDFSTDGTREVLVEYQKKFPDRVRLLFSDRNLNTQEVTIRALNAARGEFVAWLDGDDYWTAADKLQTQVDFLESHPDCPMCYHDVDLVHGEDAVPGGPYMGDRLPGTMCLEQLLLRNPIAGPASMFRRAAINPLPEWYAEAPFGDWELYVIAAQAGVAARIDRRMAAYRVLNTGAWSGISPRQQLERTLSSLDLFGRALDAKHLPTIEWTREELLTSPWYVARIGNSVFAPIEKGRLWRDGWSTRVLRLSATARRTIRNVRVLIENPVGTAFEGNEIRVLVGSARAEHVALHPGEQARYQIPLSVEAGEQFAIEIEGRAEGDGADDGRSLGFALRSIEFGPFKD
jgi:glycosyltransferase involved in cell wall biosynthesis